MEQVTLKQIVASFWQKQIKVYRSHRDVADTVVKIYQFKTLIISYCVNMLITGDISWYCSKRHLKQSIKLDLNNDIII